MFITKTFSSIAIATALSMTTMFAHADMHMKSAAASGASAAVSEKAALTNGVVRKIDKEAKKITLKHEEITNLQMPGMTMVFQVKDAALLDKVKVGDKVKFAAEKQGGAIVVTSLEVTP